MITLLSRFFIAKDASIEKKRTVYGMLCGTVGIVLNIILFGIKLFAGIISGAVSIIADAFNNLSDAGSSLVTILGFKLAAQKADRQHPYGHGRMEYVSGLIVSMIIFLMGFELIKESIAKIVSGSEMAFSPVVVIILVVSIATKCYMAFYNIRIGKKIASTALKATAFDSLSDCIATSVVLICTLVGHFTGINLDGWAGCLVSLFILYAGFSAAGESLSPLLGKAPEPEFIEAIRDLVLNFNKEQVVGVHDLMVHDYGPGNCIISLHAEVPAKGNILEIHDTIDLLEKTIEKQLNCVATIHMDPVETDDPHVNALRDRVAELVKEIHDDISIHDFRVVWGDTHTNLIFDMALPFECKYTDEEAAGLAFRLVQEKINKTYFSVIEVDRDNYINS